MANEAWLAKLVESADHFKIKMETLIGKEGALDGDEPARYYVIDFWNGFLGKWEFSSYPFTTLANALAWAENRATKWGDDNVDTVYVFEMTRDEYRQLDEYKRPPLAIWWNGRRVKLLDW